MQSVNVYIWKQNQRMLLIAMRNSVLIIHNNFIFTNCKLTSKVKLSTRTSLKVRTNYLFNNYTFYEKIYESTQV